MSHSPKSWEFDDDQKWPSDLPSKLVEKLERDIDLFVQVAELRSKSPPASRMKTDAEKIASSAADLLEKVRSFSSKHDIAIYENYRRQATENLSNDLTPGELERCRSGMDEYSLQWPLLGLIAYMNELSETPKGNSGRKRVDREVEAVEEIIRYFALLNLDSGKGENTLLFRTCKVFFARAAAQLASRDVHGDRAEPKGDDAIMKYLTAAKT